LRRDGWSYNVIADRLRVSKSTLSIWLRDIPYRPNKEVLKRVNKNLMRMVMAHHNIKLDSFRHAKSFAKGEIGKMSDRDLMMVGLGLYIGEGSKGQETVHIMNSDPDVLRLAVKWLKRSFRISLKHFRVIMHIYPDNSEEEARKYWSKITGIPFDQFEKTQVDRRTNKSISNRGKLPHGTAHVKIRACGDPEHGVLLHRRIMALINEIYRQTRV